MATCSIRVDRLSARQREILFLISKGLRNSEVAHQMKLSERSIKGYVSQLLLILDVTNRTELVGLFAPENASFNAVTAASIRDQMEPRPQASDL